MTGISTAVLRNQIQRFLVPVWTVKLCSQGPVTLARLRMKKSCWIQTVFLSKGTTCATVRSRASRVIPIVDGRARLWLDLRSDPFTKCGTRRREQEQLRVGTEENRIEAL